MLNKIVDVIWLVLITSTAIVLYNLQITYVMFNIGMIALWFIIAGLSAFILQKYNKDAEH